MKKNINIEDLQIRVGMLRDEISYKELFMFFYKPLFQFTNCMVNAPEIAEEIVSDVMMKIWEMKEDLANIKSLKLYLYKAAKNRSLNYLTRDKKCSKISLDTNDSIIEMNSGFLNPENSLIDKELHEAMTSAMQLLPPKCQIVYKLIRVDGMCYKEVAEIMGISVKTVDRHLNNALHRLIYSMRIYAV